MYKFIAVLQRRRAIISPSNYFELILLLGYMNYYSKHDKLSFGSFWSVFKLRGP